MSEREDPVMIGLVRLQAKHSDVRAAIDAVLRAADAKDQPSTSRNIPIALIERLREVAR